MAVVYVYQFVGIPNAKRCINWLFPQENNTEFNIEQKKLLTLFYPRSKFYKTTSNYDVVPKSIMVVVRYNNV